MVEKKKLFQCCCDIEFNIIRKTIKSKKNLKNLLFILCKQNFLGYRNSVSVKFQVTYTCCIIDF